MKRKKAECDLSSCLFCRLCERDWLANLPAHRKVIEINKGENIFLEGETMKAVFFVNSGTFKVHKQWGNDKELILRFARKGDIVGHRGLGEDFVFPVSATALENSSVCSIDLEFFLESLTQNSSFLYELLMFFAEELKVSERKMRNLAHMPVKGRISQALINLLDKFGTDENGYIDIVISRQDLASFAGTTYETVFRTLSDLVKLGILAQQGKAIAVLDVERLKSFTLQQG